MKIEIKHNIGKAKYLISYSNGTKKHKDGSEFFDIAIFSNKKKVDKFITQLKRGVNMNNTISQEIVREVKGKTNVSLKDIKIIRHKLALNRYKIRQGKLRV